MNLLEEYFLSPAHFIQTDQANRFDFTAAALLQARHFSRLNVLIGFLCSATCSVQDDGDTRRIRTLFIFARTDQNCIIGNSPELKVIVGDTSTDEVDRQEGRRERGNCLLGCKEIAFPALLDSRRQLKVLQRKKTFREILKAKDPMEPATAKDATEILMSTEAVVGKWESNMDETLHHAKQPAALCEVCQKEASKYKCPRCMKRTCSLMCSKEHKQQDTCRCGFFASAFNVFPKD